MLTREQVDDCWDGLMPSGSGKSRYDVARAIEALARAECVPQWRDIASAPKDGRTILLGGLNSHNKWRTMRGQWVNQDYIDSYWEEPDAVVPGWYETCVEGDVPNMWFIEPTHWMPLPAAPGITAPQGARSLVTLDSAVAAVVARYGGVRAAERATGVDKSFISRLMNGHKVAPSAETLEALGLREVPLYEVLKRPNARANLTDTAR